MARDGFNLRRLAVATLLAASTISPALGAEDISDRVDARIAFHKLKGLAGDWTGTAGKDSIPTTVTYRVGANGTVVTETLFPGTEREMITLYYVQGKDLVATHYCAMGNQPHFKLDTAKSTLKELVFAFDGGTNLDATHDSHVHDGKIGFTADGKLDNVWTFYSKGEQLSANDFHLTRAAGK